MAGRRSAKTPWRYPSHLAHSKARTGRCRTCWVTILSATYSALPIHLDPQALTPLGEMDALLNGQPTWFDIQGQLSKRITWAIKTSPVGLGGSIHRIHRCDRPQPTGLFVRPEKEMESDEPPF